MSSPVSVDFLDFLVGSNFSVLTRQSSVYLLGLKQIGKIESPGKVLKLSDKVTLTRPFTAWGKNQAVI